VHGLACVHRFDDLLVEDDPRMAREYNAADADGGDGHRWNLVVRKRECAFAVIGMEVLVQPITTTKTIDSGCCFYCWASDLLLCWVTFLSSSSAVTICTKVRERKL